MIDLNKTYKTGDGRKVRLAFIEGDYVHGHVLGSNTYTDPVTEWVPYLWKLSDGWPQSSTIENEGSPWVESNKLVESAFLIPVSLFVGVGLDGKCQIGDFLDKCGVNASFTLNLEIEDGAYDQEYTIKPEPNNVTSFNITKPEAEALQALVCYGDKEFLKVFYEKLGKTYLQPSEKALIGLFDKIRKQLPKTK